MPTDSSRILGGRKGAELSWSRTADPLARTKPGRDAAFARFEAQVDPDGRLAPEDRRRRAEHLRRAHMADISLKSAQARQAKAAGKTKAK